MVAIVVTASISNVAKARPQITNLCGITALDHTPIHLKTEQVNEPNDRIISTYKIITSRNLSGKFARLHLSQISFGFCILRPLSTAQKHQLVNEK